MLMSLRQAVSQYASLGHDGRHSPLALIRTTLMSDVENGRPSKIRETSTDKRAFLYLEERPLLEQVVWLYSSTTT